MAYFKNDAFAEDPFANALILSVPDWLERDASAFASPVAIQLDPGFSVEAIVADLATFALIRIAFPKFTDGRGYSTAWLLRSRFGYRGEMRAVGDVLFDEMKLMIRCGFDAFEITDPETVRLLKAGRRPVFRPLLPARLGAGSASRNAALGASLRLTDPPDFPEP